MSSLSVAFVVQGEGRGHMTQALAAASYLRAAGHVVDSVHVGASRHRSVPAYFVAGMGAPVIEFDAPTQVAGADGRSVSIAATAADVAARLPRFVAAGRAIHRRTARVDVVVNFLDLVGGLSRALFGTRTPCVSIAHNHLFAHPEIETPPGSRPARAMVRWYNAATAVRSVTRMALSFVTMPPVPRPGLFVAPPLLRPGLDAIEPSDDGYLLTYALNAGYANVIAAWHGRRGDMTTHCFVEGGVAALEETAPPGFHVHDLDQERFLERLAACRAYAGSAGFESLCEAYYLGKPVLAVPTEGQLEQSWNAWDAERCNIARHGSWADLDDFWSRPTVPEPGAVREFRRWVSRAPDVLVAAVEAAAGTRRTRSPT